MRAGDAARHVTAHRNRESPREIDAERRARRLLAQHRLSYDADAEHNQDERAEEFREHLAEQVARHGASLNGSHCRLSDQWPMCSRSIRAPPARAPSCSTTTAASRRWRRRSSRRSFRAPAGSSTTPGKSGRRSSAWRSRPWAAPRSRPRDIAAIGITNQRETTVSGIARPASRSTTRSSGRIAGPRSSASN